MKKAGDEQQKRLRNMTPDSACHGKFPYMSAADAAQARDGMARTSHGKRGGKKNDIYRCEYCKRWHIGHANKTRNPLRRSRQFFCYDGDR